MTSLNQLCSDGSIEENQVHVRYRDMDQGGIGMLGKVLGLPRRVARRVKDMVDGERSAPFPTSTLVSAPSSAAGSAATPSQKKAPAPPPPADVDVRPEPTPNPNAMKFSVGQTICETGSFTFSVDDTDIGHPVARAVLQVDGVKTVFGVNDFVTVTKDPSVEWDGLTPHLVSAIGNNLPGKKG